MKFKKGDKIRLNPNKNYRTICRTYRKGMLVVASIKEAHWMHYENQKYNEENAIRFEDHQSGRSYPESYLMREHETEV